MVTVTKYVWDPVFDCVTHELDENNVVKTEYHNEPQQYGGVLSQRRGTTSHYHHHDALGSTRFLTDSSGNVTDTYLNDAWGNSVASTGTTVNPFKWVGKYGYYTDNSTAQVYVRARMYQPTVARWVSLDPLRILGDVRRYLYSFNAPLSEVDPSGLWPLCQAETCNTGPLGHAGEGHYALRVEVIGNAGDRCGSAGQEIRFHMRESHINPKTQECIGYADKELGAIDPSKMRFGDIVARGCSAPQVSSSQVGPNKCWVADYRWSCPITCNMATSSCAPSTSWLSVYDPRLLPLPIGTPPVTGLINHIMRANAAIAFREQCPCTMSGCDIEASIDWILWSEQFAIDKQTIPVGAVDIKPDPVTGGWWYRMPVGSRPCEGDFSWVWRL